MKTLIHLLTTAALATLSLPADAQNGPNWRNDPTYSTHNYKHANKAAAVKRRALEPGITVNFPKPDAARFANYKMPLIEQAPAGGVVLPHTPGADLAERNYKMPRPLRPAIVPRPNMAGKTVPPVSITSE